MANGISLDGRRRGAYGRDQIGEVIAGQFTAGGPDDRIEASDVVLRYLHEDEEHQTGLSQALAFQTPEVPVASGALGTVITGVPSGIPDPFVSSAFSSGPDARAAPFVEVVEESASDVEVLSESTISEYSYGIDEELEYTASNPPANPTEQGFAGLPNGSVLSRFQEHLASEEHIATEQYFATEEHFAPEENIAPEETIATEEDIATVGVQQPATPAEYPPPYAPVDPTGTHIFPPRPPGFYIPIYHNPRSINSSVGPDAVEVRGIHIPEGVPSFVRGNYRLPLYVTDIYHNPGQDRFEYLNAGLEDGTFTEWAKNRSVFTSRICSSIKRFFSFGKSRSSQPDGSETDRATRERPSSPNWFQKWKRGHDERARRRAETIARLEASQGS